MRGEEEKGIERENDWINCWYMWRGWSI